MEREGGEVRGRGGGEKRVGEKRFGEGVKRKFF